MAFEQITLAIQKDPLSLPFRRSFEIIAGRIRAALADPQRAPRRAVLLGGADRGRRRRAA